MVGSTRMENKQTEHSLYAEMESRRERSSRLSELAAELGLVTQRSVESLASDIEVGAELEDDMGEAVVSENGIQAFAEEDIVFEAENQIAEEPELAEEEEQAIAEVETELPEAVGDEVEVKAETLEEEESNWQPEAIEAEDSEAFDPMSILGDSSEETSEDTSAPLEMDLPSDPKNVMAALAALAGASKAKTETPLENEEAEAIAEEPAELESIAEGEDPDTYEAVEESISVEASEELEDVAIEDKAIASDSQIEEAVIESEMVQIEEDAIERTEDLDTGDAVAKDVEATEEDERPLISFGKLDEDFGGESVPEEGEEEIVPESSDEDVVEDEEIAAVETVSEEDASEIVEESASHQEEVVVEEDEVAESEAEAVADTEADDVLDPIDEISSSASFLDDEPQLIDGNESEFVAEQLVDEVGDIVDIQRLPKSQPNRVLSKAKLEAEGKKNVSEEVSKPVTPMVPHKEAVKPAIEEPKPEEPPVEESVAEEAVDKPKKAKKKRVSLLDSYFRGL